MRLERELKGVIDEGEDLYYRLWRSRIVPSRRRRGVFDASVEAGASATATVTGAVVVAAAGSVTLLGETILTAVKREKLPI